MIMIMMMMMIIIIIIIIVMIMIVLMTLFRCQVIYLAGPRPTIWGYHLYHSKVDGDLPHDRHAYINTDTLRVSKGLRFNILI